MAAPLYRLQAFTPALFPLGRLGQARLAVAGGGGGSDDKKHDWYRVGSNFVDQVRSGRIGSGRARVTGPRSGRIGSGRVGQE